MGKTVGTHRLVVPTPFPVGPVNAYLLLDGGVTLVDTGPAGDRAMQALRDQLGAFGLRVRDVTRLIITHPHLDHFGLAAQIVEESGAKVCTHDSNRFWLPDFEGEWTRVTEFYMSSLEAAGAPPEVVPRLRELYRGVQRYGRPVSADVLLEDGQRLEMGGGLWEVLHCPGHSRGAICLWEAHTGQLISGDYLLARITSNPVLEPPARGEDVRPRSLSAYMDTMRRLSRLPARVVYPGHGDQVTDHRALIEGWWSHLQQRSEEVLSTLSERDLTPYEICQVLFPDLPADQLFLGLSEVVGHLDVLAERGRVAALQGNGVARYKRVR